AKYVRCENCGRTFDAEVHSSCPCQSSQVPRFIRCSACGHVFDAAASERCPRCPPQRSTAEEETDVGSKSSPYFSRTSMAAGFLWGWPAGAAVGIAAAAVMAGSIYLGIVQTRKPPEVAAVRLPDPCAGAESHWKTAEAIGTIEAFEDHLARF